VRIGLIGVGQMGGAMARCYAHAGHEVVAHDLNRAALNALAEHPSRRISAAASLAEVARSCELIAICVQNDAQVMEVLTGPEGLLSVARGGSVVLIHSTVSLETLRSAARAARAAGLALLEAPVSGRNGFHSVGELCVMVGGERDAFLRAQPALETIGSLVLHLGPIGSGMDAKLVRNTIAYQQYLVAYEALSLARELGVSPDTLARILEHTGILADNLGSFLRERGNMRPLEDPERRKAFEITTATAHKDLAAVLARAREVGLEMPVTAAAAEYMADVFGVAAPRRPQPVGT
jgi:3-hydroxyisobutyrate dehydrogenase